MPTQPSYHVHLTCAQLVPNDLYKWNIESPIPCIYPIYSPLLFEIHPSPIVVFLTSAIYYSTLWPVQHLWSLEGTEAKITEKGSLVDQKELA